MVEIETGLVLTSAICSPQLQKALVTVSFSVLTSPFLPVLHKCKFCSVAFETQPQAQDAALLPKKMNPEAGQETSLISVH